MEVKIEAEAEAEVVTAPTVSNVATTVTVSYHIRTRIQTVTYLRIDPVADGKYMVEISNAVAVAVDLEAAVIAVVILAEKPIDEVAVVLVNGTMRMMSCVRGYAC